MPEIAGTAAIETLQEKLSKSLGTFGAQLGSNKLGTLAQAWVPEACEDGSVVLNTQGLPFCVIGTADLLALFRCISCKYKFTTDTTKPWLMGAVGRVYTSGEPEVTQSVQQYDQSVYLRVAEAQRCHIHFCLFLPIYGSAIRDRVIGVLEVVQTDQNERFTGLIDWARVCLEGAGLWTIAGDGESLPIGLRTINPEFEASAFESKVEMRRTPIAATSMPPPPAPATLMRDKGPDPSNNQSLGSVQPLEGGGTAAAAVTNGWQQEKGETLKTEAPAAHPTTSIPQPPAAAAQPLLFANQEKVIRVGNNLVLSSDAAAGMQWQQQRAALASGSGGVSDPAEQQTNLANWNLGALNQLPPQQPVVIPPDAPQIALSYGQGDRVVTLEDLAPHFNVSLREAATRLGFSVTTLKRACRRLGLKRWPRREIALRAQQVAKAAAMAGPDHTNLMTWISGQTISADSSGDHQLTGTAVGANAAAPPGGLMSIGPPFGAPGGHQFIVPAQINPNALINPMMGGMGAPPLPSMIGVAAAGNGGGPLGGQNLAETQTRSLESLDILAAEDVETFSVGNGLISTGAMIPHLATAAGAMAAAKAGIQKINDINRPLTDGTS